MNVIRHNITMRNKRTGKGRFLMIIALSTYILMYFFVYFQVERRVLFEIPSELINGVKSSSGVCQHIDTPSGSPFQWVWEKIKQKIRRVSLLSTDWAKDLRSNKDFTDWVEESMSYFTFSRLQHTMMSLPIDQSRYIGRIHSIIEKRRNNPTMAPPLRIVVFGGSVTTGHLCLDNIFNYTVRNDGRGNDRAGSTDDETKLCAWSGRLQDMMNAVFGDGTVEIENLAIGGANTDISTAVIEFGLIPGRTPDIVIWDHGVNDAITKVDPNAPFYQTTTIGSDEIFDKLQKFYQSILALQKSSDDPILVILLDAMLGNQDKLPHVTEGLTASTATSKMLTWYPDIWGISYANTIRPYTLTKVGKSHEMMRLLGSNGIVTHLGMMYHISVAWVIIFNLLNALHDNCISKSIQHVPAVNDNDYMNAAYIPELRNDLRLVDVPHLWKNRLSETTDYLHIEKQPKAIASTTTNIAAHSSLTCFYAWIVNRMLKIVTTEDIDAQIQPYIVINNGWSASGNARTQSGGWLPVGGRGSSFQLQFDKIPPTVTSLSLIYMESYSEKWVNSTLLIDCTFVNPLHVANITTSARRNTKISKGSRSVTIDGTDGSSMKRHYLSGYHDAETSILVPIKLPLPVRSLEDGTSTLRLDFRLLGGETFKIAGMALC